jgi:hypothetical protein
VKGNHNKAGLSARSGDGLSTAVAWPTPVASDWKSRSRAQQQTNSRPLREAFSEATEPLNPEWVEALMGFPPGWTDLGPEGLGRLAEERRRTRGNPRARSQE